MRIARFPQSILVLLVLAAAVLLPGTASADTSDDVRKLEKSRLELQQLHALFTELVRNEPDNKGAKELATHLNNVVNAANQYRAGSVKNREVERVANEALAQTRRYSSDNARKATTALKALIRLVKQMPGTLPSEFRRAAPEPVTESNEESLTPASATSDADNENEASAPAADSEPRPRTSRRSTGATSREGTGDISIGNDDASGQVDRWVVFALMFVYLLFTLGIGALLFVFFTKKIKALRAELEAATARLDNRELLSTGTGGDTTAVAVELGQARQQLKNLEANTAEFLEIVENRLQALEHKVQEQKSGGTAAAVLPAGIEARLAALEKASVAPAPAPAATPAPQVAPAPAPADTKGLPALPPFNGKAQRLMQDAVNDVLASPAVPVPLRKLSKELIPELLEAGNTHNWGTMDARKMAQCGQQMYAHSLRTGNDAAWQRMREALTMLGMDVEDRMTGRMCFSDFYAHNLYWDQYVQETGLQDEGFPDKAAVQQAITDLSAKTDLVQHMVLYTLRPSVVMMQEGAKVVLAKGIYIVQQG